jgi:hypothetical protein
MESIFSAVITLSLYAIVVTAVWRLFKMATDLSEMKTILADIRRNTAPAAETAPAPAIAVVAPVQAGPISLESAEALLREVAAESERTEVRR